MKRIFIALMALLAVNMEAAKTKPKVNKRLAAVIAYYGKKDGGLDEINRHFHHTRLKAEKHNSKKSYRS